VDQSDPKSPMGDAVDPAKTASYLEHLANQPQADLQDPLEEPKDVKDMVDKRLDAQDEHPNHPLPG